MSFKRIICVLGVFLCAVLYAETLEEVIQQAENAIAEKYKTPIAKKSAEKKLLVIIEDSKLTDEQKIEKIKKQFSVGKQLPKTQGLQLSSDSKTLEKCNNKDITECFVPDGVTTIRKDAFAYCSKLQSVTIPNSVKIIENGAFVTVKNVKISSIHPYFYKDSAGALISKKDKKLIWFPRDYSGSYTTPNSVTTIGSGAFYNCSNLQSVTISNSVKIIENGAFSNCQALQSVTIGNRVTTIGDSAFSRCKNLQSVTIPNSVTKIGYGAFVWVKNVKISSTHPYFYKDSVGALISKKDKKLIWFPRDYSGNYTIPNSVTTIGKETFYNCFNLQSVTIPDSVTAIEDWAFAWCENLQSVTIPDSVTTIGAGAFSGCNNLQSVIISDSVTAISDNTFAGCNSLQSVTIGNGVKTIGRWAFRYCYNLQSIIIPDSVTRIEDAAFAFCKNLQSVTIPDSVTTINSGAFAFCKNLQSVTIPDSVKTIGVEVFLGAKNVNVSSTNPYFYNDSVGALISKNNKKLIWFPPEYSGNYIIPDSVTEIGASAFGGCENLQSVIIHEGVKMIGYRAFYDCVNLKEVKVPINCRIIRDAFPKDCNVIKY